MGDFVCRCKHMCPGWCCCLPAVCKTIPKDAITVSVAGQAQSKRGVAATRIQSLIRGFMIRWQMRRFRKHSNAMPTQMWHCMFGFLLLGKLWLIVSMLLAYVDAFTQSIPPPDENAPYKTPFQQHPHDFGVGYQMLVSSHVVTGFGLCVSMLIPIFTAKGSTAHIIGGRAFLFFWVLHLIDGLLNSSTVVLTRGFHERNYPTDGFSMWLYIQFSYIANCVADFLINALADVQYKIKVPRWARRILMASAVVTMVHAALFVLIAIFIFAGDSASAEAEEYAIIFLVEVPPYGYFLYKNYVHWSNENLGRRLHKWVAEHQRNMLFCANLTLITGLANVTFRIAPWATVTLWATQDILWIYWVYRMNKSMLRSLRAAKYQDTWAREKRRTSQLEAVEGMQADVAARRNSGKAGRKPDGSITPIGAQTTDDGATFSYDSPMRITGQYRGSNPGGGGVQMTSTSNKGVAAASAAAAGYAAANESGEGSASFYIRSAEAELDATAAATDTSYAGAGTGVGTGAYSSHGEYKGAYTTPDMEAVADWSEGAAAVLPTPPGEGPAAGLGDTADSLEIAAALGALEEVAERHRRESNAMFEAATRDEI